MEALSMLSRWRSTPPMSPLARPAGLRRPPGDLHVGRLDLPVAGQAAEAGLPFALVVPLAEAAGGVGGDLAGSGRAAEDRQVDAELEDDVVDLGHLTKLFMALPAITPSMLPERAISSFMSSVAFWPVR
jgi:hypothetical protein